MKANIKMKANSKMKDNYRRLVMHRLANPAKEGHKHHIIPRCFGKEDNRTVKLTLQEHTLAHYWLWKACPRTKKFAELKKHLRAAYLGLRGQWFTGHGRWRFQRLATADDDFDIYASTKAS